MTEFAAKGCGLIFSMAKEAIFITTLSLKVIEVVPEFIIKGSVSLIV
jgi:hypothetical protein